MSHNNTSRCGNKAHIFERFWNNLFTYAYDCDTLSTLLVNETFFIASALVLAWLCSLTTLFKVKILAWIALAVLILGDLYFLISFYIGIQTFILSRIRKSRSGHTDMQSYGSGKTVQKKSASAKKPRRRDYKISNRRL